MARYINMNASYTVEGKCPTCGELITTATLESSERCTRCGDELFDLVPSEFDGQDERQLHVREAEASS